MINELIEILEYKFQLRKVKAALTSQSYYGVSSQNNILFKLQSDLIFSANFDPIGNGMWVPYMFIFHSSFW